MMLGVLVHTEGAQAERGGGGMGSTKISERQQRERGGKGKNYSQLEDKGVRFRKGEEKIRIKRRVAASMVKKHHITKSMLTI